MNIEQCLRELRMIPDVDVVVAFVPGSAPPLLSGRATHPACFRRAAKSTRRLAGFCIQYCQKLTILGLQTTG